MHPPAADAAARGGYDALLVVLLLLLLLRCGTGRRGTEELDGHPGMVVLNHPGPHLRLLMGRRNDASRGKDGMLVVRMMAHGSGVGMHLDELLDRVTLRVLHPPLRNSLQL
jgi:hypothetical protein